MKKHIFLLLIFVLSSGFRTQIPTIKLYPDFDRRQSIRPYLYKMYTSSPLLIKSHQIDLKFYDYNDSKKVLLDLNPKGIFWEGKKVCDWIRGSNPEYEFVEIDKDCPDDLPVGANYAYWTAEEMQENSKSSKKEKLEGRGVYRYLMVELDWALDYKPEISISKQKDARFVVIHKGKKAVVSLQELISKGWKIGMRSGKIMESYKPTMKLLKDKTFVETLDNIDKCFAENDKECLVKYIKSDGFKISLERRPRYNHDYCRKKRGVRRTGNHIAKCFFESAHKIDAVELASIFKRREFPCVFYIDKYKGKKEDKVVIYGTNLAAEMKQDKGDSNKWKMIGVGKIRDFNYDSSVSYCYPLGEKHEDYYENGILKDEYNKMPQTSEGRDLRTQ